MLCLCTCLELQVYKSCYFQLSCHLKSYQSEGKKKCELTSVRNLFLCIGIISVTFTLCVSTISVSVRKYVGLFATNQHTYGLSDVFSTVLRQVALLPHGTIIPLNVSSLTTQERRADWFKRKKHITYQLYFNVLRAQFDIRRF